MVRIYQVEKQLMSQLTSTRFLVFQPVSDVVKALSVFKRKPAQGYFISVDFKMCF